MTTKTETHYQGNNFYLSILLIAVRQEVSPVFVSTFRSIFFLLLSAQLHVFLIFINLIFPELNMASLSVLSEL